MATTKSENGKSNLERFLTGFENVTQLICDNAEYLLADEEQAKFIPLYRRGFKETTSGLKKELLYVYQAQDKVEKEMTEKILNIYGGNGMIEEAQKIIGQNKIQERRGGIFGLIGQILEKLKELIRDLFKLPKWIDKLLDFIDNIFEMIGGLFGAGDRQDAFQVRKNALEIRMIREKGYLDLGR